MSIPSDSDIAKALRLLLADASKAAASKSTSPMPQNRARWHVDFDNLPLDISPTFARRCQQHVHDVGKSWFPKGMFVDVEFVITDGSDSSFESPTIIKCYSERDIQQALLDISPSTKQVLVLVHAIPESSPMAQHEQPGLSACSLQSMVAICEHFGVLPTFALALERNPGFWLHSPPAYSVVEPREDPRDQGNDKSDNHSDRSDYNRYGGLLSDLEFSYAAPMPWLLHNRDKEDFMQIGLCTVSSYTRLDSNGMPSFTIYNNIPSNFGDAIKQKWLESVSEASMSGLSLLLDHYTLIALGVADMQQRVKVEEMFHGIYGEARLQTHVMSKSANLDSTISKSRTFTTRLSHTCASLTVLSEIVDAIGKDVPGFTTANYDRSDNVPSAKSTVSEKLLHENECQRLLAIWQRNLQRQIGLVRSRISSLIEEQAKVEQLVLSYIAQRDSSSLASTTEQMANMAKATDRSSQQVQEMTRRMEADARQMKFLAEITAFFLPLTALATFFSMDFVSITEAGPNLYPRMGNLKYIWVYCVAFAILSGLVYAWWQYKHVTMLKSNNTTSTAGDGDMDEIDSRLAIDHQKLIAQRKQRGRQALAEAGEEWDAHKASGVDDPELDSRIWEKVLYAQRAAEIGTDIPDHVINLQGRVVAADGSGE